MKSVAETSSQKKTQDWLDKIPTAVEAITINDAIMISDDDEDEKPEPEKMDCSEVKNQIDGDEPVSAEQKSSIIEAGKSELLSSFKLFQEGKLLLVLMSARSMVHLSCFGVPIFLILLIFSLYFCNTLVFFTKCHIFHHIYWRSFFNAIHVMLLDFLVFIDIINYIYLLAL